MTKLNLEIIFNYHCISLNLFLHDFCKAKGRICSSMTSYIDDPLGQLDKPHLQDAAVTFCHVIKQLVEEIWTTPEPSKLSRSQFYQPFLIANVNSWSLNFHFTTIHEQQRQQLFYWQKLEFMPKFCAVHSLNGLKHWV